MSISSKWTAEQKRAIETVGTSLLVSAAAGSGKTSVLAERCVYLVCDAKERCGVCELLVVTFTEAAAAEMKKRITDRLVERVEKCEEAEARRLRGEMMMIEQANISTLHSFCLRLIRRHFHRLDLDPAVRVIDQDEAALLRSEVVKDLFAERYENGDEGFANLLAGYGDGRDEQLMELVVKTQGLMESVVKPGEWREKAIKRIAAGVELPLEESEIGREFLRWFEEELAAVVRLGKATAGKFSAEFVKYRDYVNELIGEVEDWRKKLARGYDAVAAEIREFKAERLPPMPASDSKNAALKMVDRVRDAIGEVRGLAAFSSEQWREGLRGVRGHTEVFLSLVEDFAKEYQRRKREIGGLDFADQERFALELLEMPDVVKETNQQFRHVLVDEYQDINEVQDRIIAAVAGDRRNQFCVGDVKQSIYRFRLAEPAKFLEKADLFGNKNGGERIDLNSNFRSRGKLIEAINGVFKILMSKEAAEIEYDESHWLNSGAKYPEGGAEGFHGVPIELHVIEKQARGETAEDELDRTEREAILVATQIREMVDGKRKVCERGGDGFAQRAIKFSDIAILLRATSKKADYFADVLRQQGIPVQTDRGGGFFEAMEIRDMLALLEVLDNQQQDVPLAAVLRSPFANVDAEGLAKIRLAYPELAFNRAAVKYSEEHTDELGKKLQEFFAKLTAWRAMAQQRPLAEVVWKILNQTGYLTFCAGLADGAQRQANLLHFHQRCKQYGKFGHGLYRFLKFVEKLKEEQETARPVAAEADENAVQLMSIHAAKGLEFPVVFVPDLGKTHNFSDSRGSILTHREMYLGLAAIDEAKEVRFPTLAQLLVRRRKVREMLAEELRLLYVAMTRAKEHLVLIGTADLEEIENSHKGAEETGAIATEEFLTGKCLLDWAGPAAARLEMSTGEFEIIAHSLAEIGELQKRRMGGVVFTPRQKELAELRPIVIAKADETAERIISRLEYRYPFAKLTKIAAARAVSAVSKDGISLSTDELEAEENVEDERKNLALKLPRCVRREDSPEAVDIGKATHRVLQHLDFSRVANQRDLDDQIESIIARRLLTKEERKAVMDEGILWLMGTEIGALLKKSKGKLIRELPVFFSCEPKVFDEGIGEVLPADRVMLRGRVDAAVETEAGLILVDYKTDRVSAEEIPLRMPGYKRQIGLYREAMERIGDKKVARAYLAFLRPGVLRKV